jgi:S-adenosyl methyltransferase
MERPGEATAPCDVPTPREQLQREAPAIAPAQRGTTTLALLPGPPGSDTISHDELVALRRHFPQFLIWREDAWGRVRYIARSQRPGLNPHTVVTADPDELRAALSDACGRPGTASGEPADSGAPWFDPEVPHPARVYNVWLRGKDHFPADRRVAAEVAACRPQVVAGAQANRAFLARAVRYLAGQRGIGQFLDIGPGLPAPDATHTVAQAITPQSRIVYVDNDPLVIAHARALFTSGREGSCDYLQADLRDPETILKDAARTLDFAKPAAVMLVAVLHFLSDADDPQGIVAALAAGLAPGSFVAISHLTGDFAPGPVASGVAVYNALVPFGVTPRRHAQVTALFGGLSLVPPGVVPVSEWRPAAGSWYPRPADLYAGLATAAQSPAAETVSTRPIVAGWRAPCRELAR